MVNYRYLGNSGLKVSEITYGNWVTHGSQVDDAAAIATVHAALDAGITTFDTADVYANTAAETVLGKALTGSAASRSRSSRRSTSRPAPRARTTPASAASTSWSRSTAR